MSESIYSAAVPFGHRLAHRYGPRVHIVADPWSLSVLHRLSHPDTDTPDIHRLLDVGYQHLLHAMSEQFVTESIQSPTRMTAVEPEARFSGRILDPNQKVVLVDVARAGMLPAHSLQRSLFNILHPAGIRVDHLFMNRVADPGSGHVTNVAFHGSKIGGSIDQATVIIPDPMGATGRSLVKVLEHYRDHVPGTPKKWITAHLIITPEYIQRVLTAFPEVIIYALRLDRGRSHSEVLTSIPGTYPDQERGLNDHDYIVPGAGGLGELINNAFV